MRKKASNIISLRLVFKNFLGDLRYLKRKKNLQFMLNGNNDNVPDLFLVPQRNMAVPEVCCKLFWHCFRMKGHQHQ